jgi:hypothetical protein
MRAGRYLLGGIVLMAIVAAGVAWYLRGPGPMAFASGSSVGSFKGPNPTGVPASLAKEDIVKRGEYLARAADCMVCHSTRGKDYAGGLVFKLPFGELPRPTLPRTRKPASAITAIAIFSMRAAWYAPRRRATPAMPHTSYSYLTDDDALAMGLSVQPRAGSLGAPAKYAGVSVQPALGDGVLVDAVQPQRPL